MSRLRRAPAAMLRLPATALEPVMWTAPLPVGRHAFVVVVGVPADQLPVVNQLPSPAVPVHDVSQVAAWTGVGLPATETPAAAMTTASRVSKRPFMSLLLSRHRRLRRPALAAGLPG